MIERTRRWEAGARPERLGCSELLGWRAGFVALAVAVAVALAGPPVAAAASGTGAVAQGQSVAAAPTSTGGTSLEAAASRAGDTGRKVAFSLIGLALAVAAVVLSFKRDFKEAVGVFAVGIVAVLLASPAGMGVLRSTVSLLFG